MPIPEVLPRREAFEVPWRVPLDAALAERDRPWNGGPYAERARALLTAAAGHVRQRLDESDQVVDGVSGSTESWVLTHGERHLGNVMRPSGGGVPSWRGLRMCLATVT